MLRYLVALQLLFVQLLSVQAQPDEGSFPLWPLPEYFGVSYSYGANTSNVGFTIWCVHGELHLSSWSPSNGSDTPIEHTQYIGSIGLSTRVSSRIGVQLGVDLMDNKRYTPYQQTVWVKKWGYPGYYETRWVYNGGESQIYPTLYVSALFNVAGGAWLGGGYGLERGGYFTIEYTI